MKLISKLFLFIWFSVFLNTTNIFASDDDTSDNELLPAEKAFAFSAEVLDDNRLNIQWNIAKNYYMYREKMAFALVGDGITNSEPLFPKGDVKDDDLFGRVEVYTDEFSTIIPFSVKPGAEYTLITNGQGCNEPIGVCYPPMEHKVVFRSAVAETEDSLTTQTISSEDNGILIASSSSQPSNATSFGETNSNSAVTSENQPLDFNEVNDVTDLRNLLAAGFEQPEFLDVDDAFKLEISASDTVDEASETKVISARFIVEEGYYLYRDKIDFHQAENPQIVNLVLPEGVIKEDEYFGEVAVFKNDFVATIIINADKQPIRPLTVSYQGCAEGGICYSPVSKNFDLNSLMVQNASANQSAVNEAPPSESVNGKTDFQSLLVILASALFAGLLLSFTPCVLPMIPILSSVIAGQGQALNKKRGGILSLVYVLGTAVTYAAMGALAGATGDQLQSYFQNIWAIGFLSLLFVVMSLGMFGVFNLQMPSSVQSRLQKTSGNMGGSIPLVFVLGLMSALIVGACVSPILISTLTIAVSQQDPVLGAQIMFAMALGMGVPLVALGFGAGYLIPRAGIWMDVVKNIFGIMLIAVAIYLLESVPEVPTLFLWGCFLVVLSIYLGSLQSDSGTLTGRGKIEKGIGIIFLVWGIIALIGAFLGQRDIFNPLPQSLISQSKTQGSKQNHFQFDRVNNSQELQIALTRANSENKHVIIDYYADWCTDCVRMEKTTFSDIQVQKILENEFVALQVDVTDPNDRERSALKKRFNVFGPPAVLFLDSAGNELKRHHFYGYKDTNEFLAILARL
ncbi:MAG: protein-disulfide reductase DsbD [Gammaproteobacteria bacterium]|nr:protein-disulfide reductase DsbD [Gammaproteobacteria bacterium]